MKKLAWIVCVCGLLLWGRPALAHPPGPGPWPAAVLGGAIVGGLVGGAIVSGARPAYVAPPPPGYYYPPPGYYYPPPPRYYYPPPGYYYPPPRYAW